MKQQQRREIDRSRTLRPLTREGERGVVVSPPFCCIFRAYCSLQYAPSVGDERRKYAEVIGCLRAREGLCKRRWFSFVDVHVKHTDLLTCFAFALPGGGSVSSGGDAEGQAMT